MFAAGLWTCTGNRAMGKPRCDSSCSGKQLQSIRCGWTKVPESEHCFFLLKTTCELSRGRTKTSSACPLRLRTFSGSMARTGLACRASSISVSVNKAAMMAVKIGARWTPSKQCTQMDSPWCNVDGMTGKGDSSSSNRQGREICLALTQLLRCVWWIFEKPFADHHLCCQTPNVNASPAQQTFLVFSIGFNLLNSEFLMFSTGASYGEKKHHLTLDQNDATRSLEDGPLKKLTISLYDAVLSKSLDGVSRLCGRPIKKDQHPRTEVL